MNELQILNIGDPFNPYMVSSRSMNSPKGLGVRDSALYVCDGTAGLKSFNVSQVPNIQLRSSLSDMDTYDVIALQDLLIITGDDGIIQYDHGNGPGNLDKLSVIPTY